MLKRKGPWRSPKRLNRDNLPPSKWWVSRRKEFKQCQLQLLSAQGADSTLPSGGCFRPGLVMNHQHSSSDVSNAPTPGASTPSPLFLLNNKSNASVGCGSVIRASETHKLRERQRNDRVLFFYK
jgi:hypothetical protein